MLNPFAPIWETLGAHYGHLETSSCRNFCTVTSPLTALTSFNLICSRRKTLALRKTTRGNRPNSMCNGQQNHCSNFSFSRDINVRVFFQHVVCYEFILTNLTARNNRFSFRNFQQPLYEGILTIGYFQASTLTWLVGASSSRIFPLQGLIRELLPPCIFDVAGQRVSCLKRQGKAVVQIWGEEGGQPLLKFFNFWQNQFRGMFPTWWWSMSLFWQS